MKTLKHTQRAAVLLSVAALCAIWLSSCQTAKSMSKKDPSVSAGHTHTPVEAYHSMAEGVTKQCPIEVDEATTLTKLEYKEAQHALAYTYLFSGGVYEDMNAQLWSVVQKTTENILKENLKKNELVTQLRNDGLTLIYIYTDKNGKELFTVTLPHGEY